MLADIWIPKNVVMVEKSQNTPSDHEKIEFVVRNTAAPEMAANGSADSHISGSFEPEILCG